MNLQLIDAIGETLLGAVWMYIGVSVARSLYLIRVQVKRANDARDDLYREVVSALAYLRQDASKGPGEGE